MKKYRLVNGKLIAGSAVLKSADILVAEGKIEDIVPSFAEVSSDYRVIDAGGCYVSPGFVDIHQHGGGGSDYMDSDPGAYYRITEAHLRHGTTAVLPTALSAGRDSIFRAIDNYHAAKADRRIRVNLLGLHLEGPYLSPEFAGAQRPEYLRGYDLMEYRAFIERGAGDICRMSTAPELPGMAAFADFAVRHGITLSIAHSAADFDTVLRAYELGFRHVTHLYSCMSSITRRGGFRIAGVLEAAYYLDGMNVEIIADGCHVPESLLKYAVKFKPLGTISLITDAMRAAGQQVSESFLGSLDDPTPVIIEDGVAKLPSREAFAGSIATADRLVRTMLGCGVAVQDAVKMVTENPLASMGLTVRKGSLKKGFDADIIFFDENVNVKQVILGGELLNFEK